ncbi:hypothetical protein ElyMa_000833300 [Elysia marginata]|uniref:Uncharacterized protein n=1 Tax=Elysia marginata TaxID=1093978 RepID=A0AAV4H2H3_9GAST|nr:hypothetical protein ElyMa_000833300 [Elysia marginata]
MKRIISIRWPDIVSNADSWENTQQQPMRVKMTKRKWRWIGHTLRKPRQGFTTQSLVWNPLRRIARERPRTTCKIETEVEVASTEKTWKELEEIASR